MYVSIHATVHPVEYAGFLALERMAFAYECVAAREREVEMLTIELGVPEAVDDVDPTCFLACG